jgi:hypothetical protein
MSDLSVKIITFDAGEKSNLNIFTWTEQIEEWNIIWPSHDILFITFQELSKQAGQQIYEGLKKKLPNYRISQDNQGTAIPGKNTYVFAYLCIKSSLSINLAPQTNDICIYKKLICQDPSIIFGTIVNNKKLIFVASHLPLDLTDKDNLKFGFGQRIEAVRKISAEIPVMVKSFGPAAPGKEYDTIFWAGNLNFRIQADGSEQLDKLLNVGVEGLEGYKEADKTNLQKTCDYIPYSGLISYDHFRRERQQGKTYNKSVIPSYCDRIIYKGNFTVQKYYSWPERRQSHYPLSIAYSEHEAVILEGFISQNTSTTQQQQRPKSEIVQPVTEKPIIPVKSFSQPLPKVTKPLPQYPVLKQEPLSNVLLGPSIVEKQKRPPPPPIPVTGKRPLPTIPTGFPKEYKDIPLPPSPSPSPSMRKPLPPQPLTPLRLSDTLLQAPPYNAPQLPPTYEAPPSPPLSTRRRQLIGGGGKPEDNNNYELKYYKYIAKLLEFNI